MKYAIAILLHIALTGCGATYSDDLNGVYMDAEFEPYFHEFLREGHLANVDRIGIFFGETPAGKTAQCYPIGSPTIVVSRAIFENMTEAKRKALIFHELGHCVLGRLFHNDSKFDDGCPASFMYYVPPSDNCLRTHWEEYVRELF